MRIRVFVFIQLWLISAFALVEVFPQKPLSMVRKDLVQTNLFQSYELEIAELEKNLIHLSEEKAQDEISKRIKKRNAQSLRQFYDGASRAVSNSKIYELNAHEIDELSRDLREHSVVGPNAAMKYDPQQKIGFCFGRAAYVHAHLVQRGIHPINIAKIFAIGKLYRNGNVWDYHVATIVRGKNRKWWAIDTLTDKALELEDWKKEVTEWDRDLSYPRLRFYLTDATKFQPLPGNYSPEVLHLEIYNEYFSDLEKSLLQSPKK